MNIKAAIAIPSVLAFIAIGKICLNTGRPHTPFSKALADALSEPLLAWSTISGDSSLVSILDYNER